jgi:hypothetical protein
MLKNYFLIINARWCSGSANFLIPAGVGKNATSTGTPENNEKAASQGGFFI